MPASKYGWSKIPVGSHRDLPLAEVNVEALRCGQYQAQRSGRRFYVEIIDAIVRIHRLPDRAPLANIAAAGP